MPVPYLLEIILEESTLALVEGKPVALVEPELCLQEFVLELVLLKMLMFD